MHVKDVMTTPVISIAPSTSIHDAATLMLAHRISGLPVVDADGGLIGMITEGDLLRRTELGTARHRPWWLEFLAGPGKVADDYVQSHAHNADEVMTTDVVTASPGDSLEDVVQLMSKRRVKRLPVVDDGRLVGVVARSDLLRALALQLSKEPTAASNDQRMEAAVRAEIHKQPWGANGLIRVHVEKGVAQLTGTVFDERQRIAARVAAENVPGIKSVEDQIVWVEPMSGIVILPDDKAVV